MKCPGSVTLSQGIKSEESDFASLGTAAHALAARCLLTETDAWEHVGLEVAGGEDGESFITEHTEGPDGIPIDKDMADAVQVYLNEVRKDTPADMLFVEHRFHCPDLHPDFFGTVDTAQVYRAARIAVVRDYKHGAGIVVSAYENPQLKYYAAGLLTSLALWNDIDKVMLSIVQPRAGLHEPVSTCVISTDDLWKWVEEELVPAMYRVANSNDTASGDHCRFCPARLRACPQLVKDFTEMEEILAKMKGVPLPEWSNEQIGRFLSLLDVSKIAGKALLEQAFTRLSAGVEVPGRKLAQGKSNREWKDGAEPELVKTFGKDAYSSDLKSPAQIEKLPLGKDMAARWAFKPPAALQVVAADDKRPTVVGGAGEMFKQSVKGNSK